MTLKPQQSPHPDPLPLPGWGLLSPREPAWGRLLRGRQRPAAPWGRGSGGRGRQGIRPWGSGSGCRGWRWGEREPSGRAWVPGGSSQQAVAPCPAPAGRVGAGRYQSSSHLSRPVGGPTGGETATRPRTRGLQQLLSLPVPCLPESPAGLSAAGIGERPSLQLLKPERPPGSAPAPSSRRSRMAASRQGPSGSPPDRAASAPRRPRDAPAEEAALRVHLAG